MDHAVADNKPLRLDDLISLSYHLMAISRVVPLTLRGSTGAFMRLGANVDDSRSCRAFAVVQGWVNNHYHVASH